MEELKKIDNIRSLWSKIDNKTKFIIAFSEHIGRSVHTIHNHWFARFWLVPEDKEDETIAYMQKYIELQNCKTVA